MRKIILLLATLLPLASAAWAEPLSLKDCLARAAATNQGLKAASYDIGIAQEQIQVARSGLLPRVDLQAGYQAQLEPQAVKFGQLVQETQEPDFAFLNFTVYGTLYDFGRTRSRMGAARMQRDAAQHNYSGSEQDLFLQVVRAYYGILEAGKLVTAANDEVVQMNSHQQTAQALFEQGVVTRNDLLQAEVRVAASRQKLYSATNGVENGWLLLNYLTGAPAQFRGQLQEESEPAPVTGVQAQPDLSKRGEIAALKDAVSAGEFAITEAKSYYYPELFAKVALDYVQNDKVREQAIMSGVLGLKVNLYDGNATSSRLRQAVQARSRDEERLRDLEARVALELAMAQNDMSVAAARIKVAQKAIQQGVENLRITKDRYQEKVGTATEVVDAQTLLTQTRTDYFQSVFDLQVAAARVKRATGEL
ncbi:MAG TPA: TolC family protein [Geomonas sp.]